MNSQTKKYMWWEGVTSQPHQKTENFAINMYVNNTRENYDKVEATRGDTAPPSASCPGFHYIKKCNKLDADKGGDQTKCYKHYSQHGDHFQRCDWIANSRQCKNTGFDCSLYN
jgi:hypothetical protein